MADKTFGQIFKERFAKTIDIGSYQIAIGVFSDKTDRKDEKKAEHVTETHSTTIGRFTQTKTNRTDDSGITNAQLLFIHEYGYGKGNVPRPVLKHTLRYFQTTLWPETLAYIRQKIYADGWEQEQVEAELKRMCMKLQQYARDTVIGEGTMLAPLKYRQGIPLSDSNQLKRSIQCRLMKDGKIL